MNWIELLLKQLKAEQTIYNTIYEQYKHRREAKWHKWIDEYIKAQQMNTWKRQYELCT